MHTEFLQLWWDTWDKHYGKHISPSDLITPINNTSSHHQHHQYQPQHQIQHLSSAPSQQTVTWDMIPIPPSTPKSNTTLRSSPVTVKDTENIEEKVCT